jgi:hypothetical protein
VLTLIEKADQPHATKPQSERHVGVYLTGSRHVWGCTAGSVLSGSGTVASRMYEARDLLPGRQMVECFKPFLRHLLSLNLSAKTLRKHRDNLWLLGGEIISDLHESPRLRKRPMVQVVFAALNDEGGPLISNRTSEEQQRSFDSTCRKLHRFLKEDGCCGW